jgi:excisionase family DNA binding protein
MSFLHYRSTTRNTTGCTRADLRRKNRQGSGEALLVPKALSSCPKLSTSRLTICRLYPSTRHYRDSNFLETVTCFRPQVGYLGQSGKSSVCRQTKGRAHVNQVRKIMEKEITEVPKRAAYSLREVAWLLSVSLRKVRYEISDGLLSSINIGNRVLVTQQQLDDYLAMKSETRRWRSDELSGAER